MGITLTTNSGADRIVSDLSPFNPLIDNSSEFTFLTSSQNPSGFLFPVTFTATVYQISGFPVPTGLISFFDGGAPLGSSSLSSGVTTFTTGALSVGSHNITAVHGGDSVYDGSTSSILVQTVNVGGRLLWPLLMRLRLHGVWLLTLIGETWRAFNQW